MHGLDRPQSKALLGSSPNTTSADYSLQIYFAERAYLEPTTMIGPSPDEIIPPVVLAFDPVDEPKRVAGEAAAAGRLRGPSREQVKLREGR